MYLGIKYLKLFCVKRDIIFKICKEILDLGQTCHREKHKNDSSRWTQESNDRSREVAPGILIPDDMTNSCKHCLHLTN